MSEVQDIFEQFGVNYCANHRLSLTQRKAMNAIQHCRTSQLGGHLDRCPNCGYEKPSYNSCRNRHCPKCQTFSKERWIDAQKADLLDIGYFHVVFTVPQKLNSLIYRNQRDCYHLLFRCVAETLQELARDKKYLGASIAHTAVLHTWGQNLCFHPHIHCIVPSGGLTALGKWQPSRKKFFLPVRVLSRKFRGKFLALLKLQIPDIKQSLLDACYRKEWVVYCKPPFKDAACVVEYLGRYTHRVAISNNRILGIKNSTVTFKWRDYKDSSRWKEMTLGAEEFIRRFLMHVLPSGFTKIRHYGFLSSRGKQKQLSVCKLQTGTKLVPKEKLSAEQLIQKLIGRMPPQCPKCGYSGLLRTGLSPPAA
jgi:predicted Zn-ribbon and HTH transcriptional regulator